MSIVNINGKAIKSKQKQEEERVEPQGIGDVIAMVIGRHYHNAQSDEAALKTGTHCATKIMFALQEYRESLKSAKEQKNQ